MASKSRFTRLDAFTKTVEDARIRTTSGGVVTVTSLLIILYLVFGEWSDYRRVVVHPELIVDKTRGEKMEIHMNVSFPRMPCQLLTLDVMDVSGEIQEGVMHGVHKVRLRPEGEGGGDIAKDALNLHGEEDAVHLDPNYCGGCYGAPAPADAKKADCCNTCEEVRSAYASISWSFGKGENVEQCEREHYSEHLEEQKHEGCRVEGSIRVNKVVGNFHFAPGKSFSNGNMHMHDLDVYMHGDENLEHTFSHSIHELRFGPALPTSKAKKASSKGVAFDHHHLNPLDGTAQRTDMKEFNFMYFVKVVSTAYLPLGWRDSAAKSTLLDFPHDLTPLGKWGQDDQGAIETNQYSVTSHKRSILGGDDSADHHKERLHARGGIPGVFFSYDISPMKVINREARSKSFSGFLVGVCAVIGGTLTVAAALDRALYEGGQRVRKLHSG